MWLTALHSMQYISLFYQQWFYTIRYDANENRCKRDYKVLTYPLLTQDVESLIEFPYKSNSAIRFNEFFGRLLFALPSGLDCLRVYLTTYPRVSCFITI